MDGQTDSVCTLSRSHVTLHDPKDSSPPDFFVRGTIQARIWRWVAISPSRDLPKPGIEPISEPPSLAGGFLTNEPPGKPMHPT